MNNRQLYDNHVSDLKRVCPQAGDVFVCPICFQVFSESEALNRENVNLGHVWPEYLRNKSETAKHQQALVCKKCNSLAGSHGDKEMQAYEKGRDFAQETGYSQVKFLYQPRQSQEILEIPHVLFKKSTNKFKLGFAYPPRSIKDTIRNLRPEHFQNNESYKKYCEYATKGIYGTAYILPYYNEQLAHIGWLTSAYLFAFYTFGYKFIFRQSLDIVRQIIRDSFQGKTDIFLQNIRENSMLSVNTCVIDYIENPSIGCEVPNLINNPSSFFEVMFLDYRVKLPIIQKSNTIRNKSTYYLLCMAEAKHTPHKENRKFDTILEIMDYQVVGSKLIPY